MSEHQIDEKEILGFIGLPHRNPDVAAAVPVVEGDGGVAELVERWKRLVGLSDAVMAGQGDDIAAIMARVDPSADGKPGE